jgi:hypothetical protein
MGTTLTGTTPATTYDSLIKVTDNGPLSGTAKYLSDGLGNDSVLALSTSSIGIATTSLPTSFALGSSTTGLSFTSASSSLNSGKIAVLKQVEIGSGNGDLTIETYAGGGGGGERMRITADGNVGIGTSSPTDTIGYGRALDIQSSTGAVVYLRDSNAPTTQYGFLAFDGTDNGLKLQNANSSGFLRFDTNATERMRITSTGNLGIGTSSPSVLIDAQGPSAAVRVAEVGGAEARLVSGGSSSFVGTYSNHPLLILTNSGEKMRIEAGGNVGIGTTPAADKILQLNNVGGAFVRMNLTNTSTGTAGTDGLSLSVETNKAIIKNQENDDLVLGANNSETQLVLKAGGNVGIGTNSPNFILQTVGSTGIGVGSTGVDGVYSDILSSVYSNNANEQNAIQASISSAAEQSGFRFQISDGGGASTQTLAYQMNRDRHIFYTNGSERIRVTSDGLTFNGDTAAANALDDYEEGTFTASFLPSTSGTITISGTYENWSYTKIGRKVTVNGVAVISALSSPVGPYIRVLGLPFIVANSYSAYGFVGCTFSDSSASYAKSVIGSWHGVNTVELSLGIDVSTIGTNDEFYVTATYFV